MSRFFIDETKSAQSPIIDAEHVQYENSIRRAVDRYAVLNSQSPIIIC